jgi:hypothetical protein
MIESLRATGGTSLTRYRRLVRRYDRTPRSFGGFLALACALICYRRPTK